MLVGPQPLRWACLFYLLSTLLSYLAGTLRGLPSMEANGQDFTLIVTLEFLGVVLMAADGIPNWAPPAPACCGCSSGPAGSWRSSRSSR